MVLPGTGLDVAAQIAERLRGMVAEMDVVDIDKITISLGVAAGVSSKNHAEKVLKKADEALYLAKQEGRNRVIVSS